MNHGFSDLTVAKIQGVFACYPGVEKAVLYGARAKGSYKPGSDIDLSIFEDLNHAELREHIERVGVVFYERTVSN